MAITQLVAGQNISIPSDRAYCFSLHIANWQWGVVVSRENAPVSLLESIEGVSTRDNKLLLNLPDIPEGVEKLAVYIAANNNSSAGSTADMSASLSDLVGADEFANIDISHQLTGQTAVSLIEVYRRNGAWKIRCVLQGYQEGLPKLLESFGFTRDSYASAVSKVSTTVSAPIEQNATQIQVSRSPVNQNYGDASITLVWKSGRGNLRSAARYFMGENFKPVSDLRIGCFYELENGQRGIVYSFDESLEGSFDGVPYIKANRAENEHWEQLLINERFRHKLNRYLVFVSMMDAHDSWEALSVSVDFQLPGLAAKKLSPTTLMSKPIYAVAMIDFNDDQTKATPLNEYFQDLAEMDRAFAWGLPWRCENNSDNEDQT
ncbi:TerD family protein [Neptunomonas japonica]|uniref:TerD family protein n=1 Tax=Neptunomonas japonica TaxID=417574 RepID=UPI0003FE7CBC|nr:TerD family protein [Neptunomonas japonica]